MANILAPREIVQFASSSGRTYKGYVMLEIENFVHVLGVGTVGIDPIQQGWWFWASQGRGASLPEWDMDAAVKAMLDDHERRRENSRRFIEQMEGL